MNSVRLNFSGTKRYRNFAFLPREGDRINISEDGEIHNLVVVSIWFDDHYGEDNCETNLNCSIAGTQKI